METISVLTDWLQRHYSQLFLPAVAFILIRNAMSAKTAALNFPALSPSQILLEEKWVSGGSQKSLWTRLSILSKCLTVTLTVDELRIRLTFPMNYLSSDHGFERRIMFCDILAVKECMGLHEDGVEVRFKSLDGHEEAIWLGMQNKNREAFLQIIQAGPRLPPRP